MTTQLDFLSKTESDKTPQWCNDYLYRQFSSGPYMGDDGKAWCNSARRWLKKFCKSIGATDFDFHINHYEFSGFFNYSGQWWYFSSGDCRFKICNWFLIRTAKHNKDYTGGVNQRVNYNSRDFMYELECIVKKVPFYALP